MGASKHAVHSRPTSLTRRPFCSVFTLSWCRSEMSFNVTLSSESGRSSSDWTWYSTSHAARFVDSFPSESDSEMICDKESIFFSLAATLLLGSDLIGWLGPWTITSSFRSRFRLRLSFSVLSVSFSFSSVNAFALSLRGLSFTFGLVELFSSFDFLTGLWGGAGGGGVNIFFCNGVGGSGGAIVFCSSGSLVFSSGFFGSSSCFSMIRN